ncbi:MAG TPA: GNAT family N-acetyltransferase [Acidimicrobiales bacterium]|nr:GNAT family N-acetyltransferase [Acidimicrobiales bacterium]
MSTAAHLQIRTLEESEVDTVSRHLGLARLYQGDGAYLVAWYQERPVGHAYLTRTDPPQLQDVEVLASFRRQGVAHRLVAAVETEARARGARSLRLSVSARDLDVQRLYRSLGFVDVGVAPLEVRGVITIRTGPIEVNDTLLTWEKALLDAG